uniref:Uncharacterized protein n=1 Tax=Panagrolaimus sp. ES5 TaxID=591445 RepID=A0AC34FNG7_9BILA
MNAHKVSSIISRRTLLPAIRYRRLHATDKKEPLSNGPGLQSEFKDRPHETEYATVGGADKKEGLNHGPQPPHLLNSQYKDRIQPSRVGREADPLTGMKPTISQKYFLILTRLFKNQSEIPEYVPNPTMKRMHDRMRAVVILTAFTLFYVIAYTSEWRTRRQMDIDKAAGKVVRTYADIKS